MTYSTKSQRSLIMAQDIFLYLFTKQTKSMLLGSRAGITKYKALLLSSVEMESKKWNDKT